MGYFNVNWNKYTTQLAAIANKENWSNSTYPNNGILANYIVKTYEKLSSEKKIAIGKIMLYSIQDYLMNIMILCTPTRQLQIYLF